MYRAVQKSEAKRERLKRLLRSAAAGLAATGVDLLTLSFLVSVAHFHPRLANVPALLVGGLVNFVANRSYAFRARRGNAAKQAIGFSVVECVAFGLNGALYDAVIGWVPHATEHFLLVRLLTTNVVFLGWSYPLWHRVFRAHRTECPS